MPANLDFDLYFNIAFFGVIGLAFLFGYMRGLKKSLYSLVTTLIFYALFFFTIDVVISFLWTAPLPFVFQNLSSVAPDLASATSFGDALTKALNTYLSEFLADSTLTNEVFLSLATGLGQFVLKLVYTVLYFTLGTLLYKFVMLIIRAIFFSGGKKDKHANKHRLFGALAGAAKGGVSVFITVIMLGGMFNILESMLILIPDDATASAKHTEVVYLSSNYPQYIAMDNTVLSSEQEDAIIEARKMVSAFNSNVVVSSASSWVLEHEDYAEPVPMNLYLFDSVLSFDFQEDRVYLRSELESLAGVANLFVNSEYASTNDLSDITKSEVISVFQTLAESEFVVNVIPLAIEVGSDYLDTEVDIPTEELYDIDWSAELSNIGVIAGVGFEILNTAGMLEENPDLETVQFDGTKVKELFDSLAESDLATLAAFIVLEPLVEGLDGTLGAVITIPEDLDWAVEFRAFGLVAKEVLDQNITMADIDADNPTALITTMAELDFTVLLDSRIVSHALKNIFSGDAGIEGMDIIVVPDGTIWFDVLNADGTVQTPGELRNILNAVSAIVGVVDDFSLTNIGIDMISNLTDESIDTIFDSGVLVATISDYLLNMDLGDTPLIVPDAVLDSNGYIKKAEMKQVASSAKVLVTDLACDEGDLECENGTGFDFGKAFDLTDQSIDTLLASEILGASVGQLIIDSGGEMVTIPTSATVAVAVDGVDVFVVSSTEVKNMFKAVSVLGFSDLDNMEFGASIINTLALESDPTTLDPVKSTKLFGSKIIHATISDMLFEQTEGVDSSLVVPRLKQDDITEVVYNSAVDSMDYLEIAELDAILQALITLDIVDFADVGSLDITKVIDNSATLLESSILQATISKQLIDLGSDTIIIPEISADDKEIKIVVGTGVNEITYIDKDEIVDVLDVLKLLNITDINEFDGQVDIATIIGTEGNIDIMLESAIIHATISDQLVTLDAITVPTLDDLDVNIRFTKNSIEFVDADEIKAMMDALNVLEITDIESFSGTVGFDKIMEGDNRDVILASSTIRATMSKQLIDLDTDGSITLPHFDELNAAVRVEKAGVEFVVKAELEALIDALDILEITDIESFSGTVPMNKLTEGSNFSVLVASAMIQATISEQVLSLEGNVSLSADFVVPYLDFDNTMIRKYVGVAGTDTTYITKLELEALIDSLDLIGVTDVEAFTGTVDLATFYEEADRDTLFGSAIMHATISKQITELDGDVLDVPTLDASGTAIRELRGVGTEEVEYITKIELHAVFEALELLGVGDINQFDGVFAFDDFDTDPEQEILLASGLIHYTVSAKLFDLDTDNIIILPEFDQDGELAVNAITKTVGSNDYVVKGEVKALINAFNAMNYSDLAGFSGSIESAEFFNNKAVLLASSAIQATLSDKMITGTAGVLIIPDEDADTSALVRIVKTDGTVYIDIDEMNAILLALEALGLTDFTAMDFNPTNVFSVDKATLLASTSIQATISDTILPNALDESAPDGAGTLIIPNSFRQDISIEGVTVKQVSYNELLALLNALDALGVSDFGGGMSGSTITALTAGDIDTLLLSGSLHTTIDNMFRANSNVTDNIHTATMETNAYGIVDDILVKAEIKAFILATKEMAATDFATVTFGPALFGTVSSNSSRAIIFDSMIIRKATSADLVTLAGLSQLELLPADRYSPWPLDNTDYTGGNMGDSEDYLTKATFLDILEFSFPATS
jgi:hypothetical protein